MGKKRSKQRALKRKGNAQKRQPQEITAFKSLFLNGVPVEVRHYLICPEEIKKIKIKTDVSFNSKEQIVTVNLKLTNLIVGQEYTVTGQPVYKKKFAYVANSGIKYLYTKGSGCDYKEFSTDAVTFTAEDRSKEIQLVFYLDPDKLTDREESTDIYGELDRYDSFGILDITPYNAVEMARGNTDIDYM